MEEAEYLSDRISIIDYGKIIVTDSPENLRSLVGNDVITVNCKDCQKLKNELEKQSWVEKVLQHNGLLEVYVEEGENKIPAVVKIAEEANAGIKFINLRKPSLEDIYLYYTGRMMRKEESNANEGMKIMARRLLRR
jgi:ABC-2 type transport system ATP-binding protein